MSGKKSELAACADAGCEHFGCVLSQTLSRTLDADQAILPGGPAQRLDVLAMTGKERSIDGKAAAMEHLGHEAHLGRSAGHAVDQEDGLAVRPLCENLERISGLHDASPARDS